MKYSWFAAVAVGLVTCAGAQQAPPPADVPAEHPGTVIFSRSVEDGEAPVKQVPATAEVRATDGEREAITFLTYDLDVHLQPREHAMAVRANVTVRNDSSSALSRLALQISSSLRWTGVRVGGAPVAFSQQVVNSDIDHTGALREAIIPLARPLGPQESLSLDLTYEGTAALSANRLEQIGTPADIAEASDWDRVSEEFVGLRGFGNVAWYPVASVPVALGDGAKFFTEAAAERQRQSQATVTMRVTEEFFGEAPNLAVLDGEVLAVTPTSLPAAAGVPGIVSCTLPAAKLGLASPSLFLLARTGREGNGVKVFARTEDVANAQVYLSAASIVAPLINHWLGNEPRGELNIVDLPEGEDAPFEDGDVLFANVHATEPGKLTDALIHSMSHLYFRSPYAWLQEGVPSFMGSLWMEQNRGRDVAIQQMDNTRGALSLVEPGDAGTTGMDQQALLAARDPVYYRTKATYVFWMLRDLAGDNALARALRAYQPGSDTAGTGFEQVLAQASGKDLKWFFDDWVYHDRGLPDLSIAGVFPNKASVPGSYIVAVDVANSGTAEAQVP
ncbi:MAG: hypothetical protein QOJ42_6688, partial [Acidobacteriaceae bacterium]|nr:hypothetical protein [Acidobacteriaceae bacterium]